MKDGSKSRFLLTSNFKYEIFISHCNSNIFQGNFTLKFMSFGRINPTKNIKKTNPFYIKTGLSVVED